MPSRGVPLFLRLRGGPGMSALVVFLAPTAACAALVPTDGSILVFFFAIGLVLDWLERPAACEEREAPDDVAS